MTRRLHRLGSNLGDPRTQVRSAIRGAGAIAREALLRARRVSTAAPPWGVREQPEFVNAAAELRTQLSPRELLEAMLAIERAHGRERDGTRWGPRLLDLDLLLYGDQSSCDETGCTCRIRICRARLRAVAAGRACCRIGTSRASGRCANCSARIDASGCTPIDDASAP